MSGSALRLIDVISCDTTPTQWLEGDASSWGSGEERGTSPHPAPPVSRPAGDPSERETLAPPISGAAMPASLPPPLIPPSARCLSSHCLTSPCHHIFLMMRRAGWLHRNHRLDTAPRPAVALVATSAQAAKELRGASSANTQDATSCTRGPSTSSGIN